MKRVTGLGGVFFKSKDGEQLMKWYREHLGIEAADYGFSFLWQERSNPEQTGYTVWAPFSQDTEYFAPSEQPYMLNYRVADLTALVPALRDEGVTVVGDIEQHENGKFAWILDPEGRKIELWEPVDSREDPYLQKE